MRLLRIIGYGFMAFALAGGWGFLYWQSGAVDLAAVEGARVALSDLRAVDSAWNQRIVNTRLQGAAPAPVQAPSSSATRFRTAYAALEAKALRLSNARIGGDLWRLRTDLEEKSALTDRFADAEAAHAAARRAEPPDEARITELRSLADRLFVQAWLAPTGPRLDTVARGIDRTFEEALTQSELYRVGLLFYSGFLLVVLAFLAWVLDQRRREIDGINRQLLDANETLEARVAERTRELSDALAKLKESEAMLIQSEKMASLGQMVAGIAHEVNTPLAYVKSSLEAVAKSLPGLGGLAAETRRLLDLLSAESADEAALAAQFAKVRGQLEALRGDAAVDELSQLTRDGLFGIGQISEVVSNLKDFSRLDRGKVAECDLHQCIDSAIRIARQQLQHRVVRKAYGTLPRISCSPSQINQVILNLLSNAAQATREGDGTIIIRTAPRGSTQVAVEIADNGEGIPAEVLPKIFDPFFTTKAVGKGTGLGLSICYKIVENHGGKLEVRSEPGKGTRFTLVLPVTPPASLAA